MTDVLRSAALFGALGGALMLAPACDSEPSGDKPHTPPPADLRIGAVMIETGHRFETAGRAATAGRWEMASYQAHEIVELFEDDMQRALLPGECDDAVADATYEGLLDEQLPRLREAAANAAPDRFRAAFATVSRSCNGCHDTCGVGFVEVPPEPGRSVPSLEIPASSREPRSGAGTGGSGPSDGG